ncbi:hypothetical protein ACFSQ3_14690 [Sphingobacterium corticis]|uniref:Uncharacterized protein n=1 Tax=Sphingobacterium corticis TaxID=1812823 RepID=A0ABW5NQA5_9SPHI
MSKRKVAPGVSKSLYPLDWDRSCSDQSFNEWQSYIRQQCETYSFVERQQKSLIDQVNLILSK